MTDEEFKDLGCGNGYCDITGHRSGQHTNGGCHCLADLRPYLRQVVRKALTFLREKAAIK